MTNRPTISAVLLADINESAASRLLRKLDKSPTIADSWTWSYEEPSWKVDTGSEILQIVARSVTSLADIKCSCLLAPKCFHVLAVSNTLAIADDVLQTTQSEPSKHVDLDREFSSQTGKDESTPVSQDQLLAANMMNEAVAEVLGSGLRATGGSIQSKLLRAIHECRSTGLHRLSAAGLRIINHARLGRTGSEEFLPADTMQSMHEALLVANHITKTDTCLSPQWMGTVRRRYRPVANLKLFGLCCEPVLTASGHAGVVTWMLNEQGEVVSISDVQPGTADRVAQAWRSSVTLAGLALSHADLSQQKLLISKATISDDGRVGGSDSAKAVPSNYNGWNSDTIAARFVEPLTTQIQRYFDQRDAVGTIINEGASLMFLAGTVCGYEDNVLVLQLDEEIEVKLTITVDTKNLPFRENLTLLSRAPGLKIRCLCRVLPLQPGHFQLLAIGQAPAAQPNSEQTTDDLENDVPQLQTTDGCHLDLGLETLQRSQLSTAHKKPVSVTEVSLRPPHNPKVENTAPEGLLNDWLQAIMLGGRHALSNSTIKRLIQDARNLQSNFQPTASQALKTLAQQAIDTQTTFEGLRFPGDSKQLAKAWLAAAIVQNATQHYQQKAAWLAFLDQGRAVYKDNG